MSILPSSHKIVRFGDYQADLDAGELRKSGLRVVLHDQPFKILATLLEHNGEIVTREELRKQLWPNDVFVDFDNNLNSAVARLRDALNDSPEHPRFIETVPKRGYRFVAHVPASQARAPRLVVLPFTNVNGDPAEEYFSDAVTEEIISRLARLAPEHLGVIARTTAMHYKGTRKDVNCIRQELGIDYAVEGSVRRVAERVAVSVQLIRALDQTLLWTDRYEGQLRDIFAIENSIAQALAAQMGIPAPRVTSEPTRDVQAYNLYLQGRHAMNRWTPEGLARAKQCFEEATERDHKFALAYDCLGELYWYLGFFGILPPKQASSTGILAAMRALELDNTLAETHALLGWYRKELDFDWPEVEREMMRARELNPASPVVRLRYAKGWLCPQGRVEEAAAEIARALESDPLSNDMRYWLGIMLWLGRHYDRAIEEGSLLVEQDPAYPAGHFGLGIYYREKQMYDEAIAAHRRAAQISGGAPVTLGWLGLALAQSGNADEARGLLERLRELATKAYVPPTSLAWIHLGLGEWDDAFTWMDRAIDARDHMMTPIKTYPFLDPVRSDPRYLTLLRRMKLEPEHASHSA